MTDHTTTLLFILTVLCIASLVIILCLAQDLKESENQKHELSRLLHSHMTQNQIYQKRLRDSFQNMESLAEIYKETPSCGQNTGKDSSSPTLETMACWAGKDDTSAQTIVQSGTVKATSGN